MARGLLVALLLVSACTTLGEPQIIDGLVIEVTGSSPARVDSFTLRTADGQQLSFALGPLALDDGAFPPNHLREHQALATPVRVTYRPDAGRLIAVRLEDAPG